ncbi:uncharacterized protein EV422DRAFT_570149 [Fimicolochytrium jonesii]|uniref:uncharacterized protein n=1 Tax=Fimicolochytrium jonesii TaxID=1396493 RepID=UPI0022FEC8D8|nr:uncharacterized protein EV422DRAFT_570149 [Fimicolochytrium jonesii]KAI8818002.1 hypothetical protein EV422DRAFT_570149 [Fimicolochytrium jonesii]
MILPVVDTQLVLPDGISDYILISGQQSPLTAAKADSYFLRLFPSLYTCEETIDIDTFSKTFGACEKETSDVSQRGGLVPHDAKISHSRERLDPGEISETQDSLKDSMEVPSGENGLKGSPTESGGMEDPAGSSGPENTDFSSEAPKRSAEGPTIAGSASTFHDKETDQDGDDSSRNSSRFQTSEEKGDFCEAKSDGGQSLCADSRTGTVKSIADVDSEMEAIATGGDQSAIKAMGPNTDSASDVHATHLSGNGPSRASAAGESPTDAVPASSTKSRQTPSSTSVVRQVSFDDPRSNTAKLASPRRRANPARAARKSISTGPRKSINTLIDDMRNAALMNMVLESKHEPKDEHKTVGVIQAKATTVVQQDDPEVGATHPLVERNEGGDSPQGSTSIVDLRASETQQGANLGGSNSHVQQDPADPEKHTSIENVPEDSGAEDKVLAGSPEEEISHGESPTNETGHEAAPTRTENDSVPIKEPSTFSRPPQVRGSGGAADLINGSQNAIEGSEPSPSAWGQSSGGETSASEDNGGNLIGGSSAADQSSSSSSDEPAEMSAILLPKATLEAPLRSLPDPVFMADDSIVEPSSITFLNSELEPSQDSLPSFDSPARSILPDIPKPVATPSPLSSEVRRPRNPLLDSGEAGVEAPSLELDISTSSIPSELNFLGDLSPERKKVERADSWAVVGGDEKSWPNADGEGKIGFLEDIVEETRIDDIGGGVDVGDVAEVPASFDNIPEEGRSVEGVQAEVTMDDLRQAEQNERREGVSEDASSSSGTMSEPPTVNGEEASKATDVASASPSVPIDTNKTRPKPAVTPSTLGGSKLPRFSRDRASSNKSSASERAALEFALQSIQEKKQHLQSQIEKRTERTAGKSTTADTSSAPADRDEGMSKLDFLPPEYQTRATKRRVNPPPSTQSLSNLTEAQLDALVRQNNARNGVQKCVLVKQPMPAAKLKGMNVSPSTKLKNRMEQRKKVGTGLSYTGGEPSSKLPGEGSENNSSAVQKDDGGEEERERQRKIRWRNSLVNVVEYNPRQKISVMMEASQPRNPLAGDKKSGNEKEFESDKGKAAEGEGQSESEDAFSDTNIKVAADLPKEEGLHEQPESAGQSDANVTSSNTSERQPSTEPASNTASGPLKPLHLPLKPALKHEMAAYPNISSPELRRTEANNVTKFFTTYFEEVASGPKNNRVFTSGMCTLAGQVASELGPKRAFSPERHLASPPERIAPKRRKTNVRGLGKPNIKTPNEFELRPVLKELLAVEIIPVLKSRRQELPNYPELLKELESYQFITYVDECIREWILKLAAVRALDACVSHFDQLTESGFTLSWKCTKLG